MGYDLLPQLLINGPDLWRLHKEESEEIRRNSQSVDNIHSGLANRVMKTLQCLDQLPFHLHEGPFLRSSSQTETILDGEVGNADLSLVKLVSLISLLIGQYISPPQ